MCTSNEIVVTTKSIITDRPSTRVPTSTSTPSFANHVLVISTAGTGTTSWPSAAACSSSVVVAGSSAANTAPDADSACSSVVASWWASLVCWIHWTPMTNDNKNASDNAKMPISAPLYFQALQRLPKKSRS